MTPLPQSRLDEIRDAAAADTPMMERGYRADLTDLLSEVDRLTTSHADTEALLARAMQIVEEDVAVVARVTGERDEARAHLDTLVEIVMAAAPVTWTGGASEAAYEWEKRVTDFLRSIGRWKP